MQEPRRIIDISQPVNSESACFPGDVPFSFIETMSYDHSGVLNLTAFTMSPHVGTHADAPVHVRGVLDSTTESAADMPISAFVGPAVVIDLAPWRGSITWKQIECKLNGSNPYPKRILFKTMPEIRYDIFETSYAWIAPDLIDALAERGVCLIGLDTPSVDPVNSKTLDTHHKLLEKGMYWLENLDFTQADIHPEKNYFLSAAPLRMQELEASPVRAILLEF